jgi:chromosomal replication initiation ATPase DnaA
MLVGSNPFATRFVRPGALRYRFTPLDHQHRSLRKPDQRREAEPDSQMDDIIANLKRHRVGLVVGPHGSGKTTLLQSLRPRLDAQFADVRHAQLCREAGRWMARLRDQHEMARQLRSQIDWLPTGGLLIIDGAELLGVWKFQRLLRRASRRGLNILATSHRPLANSHVLYRTEVSPQLVQQLVDELIGGAPEQVCRIVQQHLANRQWSPTENVRELFFELYDVVHDSAALAPSRMPR